MFPKIGHDKMFLEVDAIVQCCREIDEAAGRRDAAVATNGVPRSASGGKK